MFRASAPPFFLFFALLCGLAAAQESSEQAALGTRSVLDGVYSKRQAERGKRAYDKYCSYRCHGRDLNGGNPPPLHTALFLDVWREDHLATLYDFIATRMPKGREFEAGSLPERDYLDILAYLLAFNGFPAGAAELARADLDATLLVGLNGPEPLPPSALVRVVGCFEGEGKVWRLTRASLPARVRVADETDAAELARSAATPQGAFAYDLNNLEHVHAPDVLEHHRGRRVQVKGALNGGGAAARVHALSLEPTGVDDCGS